MLSTSFQEEARERSRRIWDAMAPGWETGRQDLWEFSRPISEWLVERPKDYSARTTASGRRFSRNALKSESLLGGV